MNSLYIYCVALLVVVGSVQTIGDVLNPATNLIESRVSVR